MKRVWLFVLLFGAALQTLAAAPRSIQSVYDLHYGGGRIGEVTESFTRDDGHYSIESTARAIGPLALILPGPLVLSSKGEITAEGLRPIAFHSRQGNNEKKKYFADFRWGEGVLKLHKHNKTEQHDLRPGTFDTLSLIYQFLFEPPIGKGRTNFFLTTGRKLQPYAYRIVGEEKIKTPLGTINAIRIAKLTTSPEDSSYDVWFDKDRHFVPVRVVAKDDEGRMVEQVLRSITIN
jgi:hypothetical protein